MGCGTSDGELNPTRVKLLTAIKDTPLTLDEVADETALPLYAVRSNLRYMTEVDFLTLEDDKYTITSKAINLL